MLFAPQQSRYVARRSKKSMLADIRSETGFEPIKSRLIDRNTLEWHDANGDRVVRLHLTDILRFKPDGSVVIDTNGWHTVTTKDRLNRLLPSGWNVSSDGGWIIRTPKGVWPFADGVTFTEDGAPTPMSERRMNASAKRAVIDKKMIARWIKQLKEKGWRDPGGDPWVAPNADGLFPADTMRDWLRTTYVTRLVVVSALRWGGLSDVGISLTVSDMQRCGAIGAYRISTVRRFIKACLGLER